MLERIKQVVMGRHSLLLSGRLVGMFCGLKESGQVFMDESVARFPAKQVDRHKEKL